MGPLPYSSRLQYGLEVDSASNKNYYQGYLPGVTGGRGVGLTTLPPSCADCQEILEASFSWKHYGLSRPAMGWVAVAGNLYYVTYLSLKFHTLQCISSQQQ
jgi:hypothetical protein